MQTKTTPKYEVALRGIARISSGADYVWAVVGVWGDAAGFYKEDLTYAQATAMVASKK